jgi:GTPase SAR1 family protein
MYFLETSAKASDNVERLFTEIAQDLLQQARSKDLPSFNSPSVQQILDPAAASNLGASSSVLRQKCCQSVT